MSRFQQHGFEPRLAQCTVQLLRQRASFQADPRQFQPEFGKPGNQRLRFTRHLSLANNLAVGTTHTLLIFRETSIPA